MSLETYHLLGVDVVLRSISDRVNPQILSSAGLLCL